MRRSWVVLLVLLVASCTPEIGSGTYFCGPERYCPPNQTCDDSTFTCVNPLLAEPFTCPEGSLADEPDDDLAEARDLGVLALAHPTVLGSYAGCIPTAGDVDLVRFECDAGCAGSGGGLEIALRYPVAFLPIEMTLLDETGEVIAAGELCTPVVDYTGMDYLCISHTPALGGYYLSAAGVAGAPACDGGCAFNRYSLDIKFLR